MKFFLILTILLTLSASFYFSTHRQEPIKTEKQVTYRSIKVRKRDMTRTLEAIGNLRPRTHVDVNAPFSGQINDMLVHVGDFVEQDQTIGWMSSEERIALLEAAESNSMGELVYWEEVYTPTPLIAPLSGTIISQYLERGEMVTSNELLLEVIDEFIIITELSEANAKLVRLGQPVIIRLAGYPDRPFAGEVEELFYMADSKTTNKNYEVDIQLNQFIPFAKSGMKANIEFSVEKMLNVATLPIKAIHQTVEEAKYSINEEPKSISFVLIKAEGKHEPQKQAIITGVCDSEYIEVVHGLKENDEVLIRN